MVDAGFVKVLSVSGITVSASSELYSASGEVPAASREVAALACKGGLKGALSWLPHKTCETDLLCFLKNLHLETIE